jgi:RNA polymerase sigma-70 factor (ECF subfamily)
MNRRARSVPAPASQASDSSLAAAVKALAAAGNDEAAREQFGAIVERHQRRALRIAYHYLGDAAEAEEAVQDAFVKVFSHLDSYREELPFEVWFTRVLINSCLDRRKARGRRERWLVPMADTSAADQFRVEHASSRAASPEREVLARERWKHIKAAVDRLPDRQRLVFSLCVYGDQSAREVSAVTGMNESTVRVHLFRAVRKLRTLLEGWSDAR